MLVSASLPVRYFNPHPRTEGDLHRVARLAQLRDISTHTLARRVTPQPACSAQYGTISTHTLARRVTEFKYAFDLCMGISTHTLARRVT